MLRKNLLGAYAILGENIDMFFFCDVLHHLSKDYWDEMYPKIFKSTKIIVIKDIDCTHRFGNFMNKFHDRVINHEKIRNINPVELERILTKFGYSVEKFSLPKLWYPHFLLIATKM